MSLPPGAMLYTQGYGSRPEQVEIPLYVTSVPTAAMVNFPVGKRAIDTLGNSEYTLTSLSSIGGVLSATWTLLGTNGGALNTLTGDSGGAISPSAGNINLLGTGSQITTTGGGSTITFSIPATFVAPGSIRSTTTLTAGTSLSVTTTAVIGTGLTVSAGGAAITGNSAVTGTLTVSSTLTASNGFTVSAGTSSLKATTIVGTTLINTSGAATTSIGIGPGTGAVHIGNATGNTIVDAGNLTATLGNIVASAGNIVATLGNISTGAGSITSATTLTATLGAITATNGNLVLGAAGNKIVIATGANASVGTSGVMAGTPGVVVVPTTACSATAKVFYCRNVTGGTPGQVSITAQDGTGFTLTSTGNETSTFNWWIINA